MRVAMLSLSGTIFADQARSRARNIRVRARQEADSDNNTFSVPAGVSKI